MDAVTNTCRCRFCGNSVPYMAADAGREIKCPRCGQEIKLPGRLTNLTVVRRVRTGDILARGMEVGGIVLMFLFFPWGLFAGAVLLIFGWRKSNAWVCDNCQARLDSRWAESCPKCRIKFGSE